MDEQRKRAILFSATILAARKLAEIWASKDTRLSGGDSEGFFEQANHLLRASRHSGKVC